MLSYWKIDTEAKDPAWIREERSKSFFYPALRLDDPFFRRCFVALLDPLKLSGTLVR